MKHPQNARLVQDERFQRFYIAIQRKKRTRHVLEGQVAHGGRRGTGRIQDMNLGGAVVVDK